MKKILLFSLLTSITLLNACRKEDNAKLPGLVRVPLPLLTKDPAAAVIVASDAANFTGKIIVDLYFKNDAPPQKYDLVVIKNGDRSNVKVVQENITSFPTTVTLTGPKLATLFGAPISACDFFDFGVNMITKEGQNYEAFPITGTAYAAGIAAQPGTSTTVRYATKVEFVAADYAGNFVVVDDEWADYHAGDVIPITVINGNQISFKYAVDPGTSQPIIMTISPATLAISVARQLYGSYGGTPVYAESVTGNASVVSPCERSLSLRLRHTSASGTSDFGSYTIKLRKQ